MASYTQDVKNRVRELLLPQAIKTLTRNRHRCSVVRTNELLEIAHWFAGQYEGAKLYPKLMAQTKEVLEEWISFHRSVVGRKKVEDIRVLYLCGPEPLNDLNVFTRCGINIHNVWAVTGSDDYASALDQIKKNCVALKLHRGSLKEFFERFNESFDIIYYDACGPFCGGKPNTLEPVINIFQNERLTSPGILITNFCQPPEEDTDNRGALVDYIATYFAPRYRDLPRCVHSRGPDPAVAVHEIELLRVFASQNLDEMYSDFVTRFIVELGMTLIPYWRVFSTGTLSRTFLLPEPDLKQILHSDSTQFSLEILASSTPLASFLRKLHRLRPGCPMLSLLNNVHAKNKGTFTSVIEAASMVDAVFDGYWHLLSPTMKTAIGTSWFDYKHRVTCDVPLPNLIGNSLIGMYGKPWFINPRYSQRISYKAKVQRMYCDMFLLDQCRSYFDWFPVVEALPARFESNAFQIVARSILDRIERHNFSCDSHPFRGSSVTATREKGKSCWYEIGKRKFLN